MTHQELVAAERVLYAGLCPDMNAGELRAVAAALDDVAEFESRRDEIDLTRLYALHHAGSELRRAAYWRTPV